MPDERHEEPRAPEQADPVARAGRTGRRVALAIYWVFMIYIMVVGFRSVIPQAFWPEPVHEYTMPEDCDAGLQQLTNDLRQAMARQFGPTPPSTIDDVSVVDPRDLPRFLQRWDDQHLALRAACEGDPRHARLASIRHRLQDTLRRIDREEGRALALLERSLRPEEE